MKKVWIDAGHGGKDPGAVGHGLQEKDITLMVAIEIKDRLESEYDGVNVTLSRYTDVFLELKDRSNKANADRADLLVSIHCNAGGGSGGFETFRYTNASAQSRQLQTTLHTEIMTALQPYGVIDRGRRAGNLHMCRETQMPAVLTENLFIDVKNDADKLKRTDVIEAIICGHVLGIAKFLGLMKKVQVVVAEEKKAPTWKGTGREWLINNAHISSDWKATDQVDIGTLGTILSRLMK